MASFSVERNVALYRISIKEYFRAMYYFIVEGILMIAVKKQ
jgi:hypothetical protein